MSESIKDQAKLYRESLDCRRPSCTLFSEDQIQQNNLIDQLKESLTHEFNLVQQKNNFINHHNNSPFQHKRRQRLNAFSLDDDQQINISETNYNSQSSDLTLKRPSSDLELDSQSHAKFLKKNLKS